MNDAPDPLVPAEVDLRGLPFMPLDVVRLMDSDLFALATGDEFKAAVALWCKCWLQVPAGSLPNDDRVLAHLSGAGSRWGRVKAMALRGFTLCSDGRLYHAVIAVKAHDAWQHRIAQRERAQRRWHNTGNATASPTAHADAHATASATAMQGTGRGTVKGKGVNPPTPRRAVALPDWVPAQPWQDFVAMRKACKKPLGPGAMELAIRKLDELRAEGHTPQAVLEQSVLRGWQGLFPVAADEARRNGHTPGMTKIGQQAAAAAQAWLEGKA